MILICIIVHLLKYLPKKNLLKIHVTISLQMISIYIYIHDVLIFQYFTIIFPSDKVIQISLTQTLIINSRGGKHYTYVQTCFCCTSTKLFKKKKKWLADGFVTTIYHFEESERLIETFQHSLTTIVWFISSRNLTHDMPCGIRVWNSIHQTIKFSHYLSSLVRKNKK